MIRETITLHFQDEAQQARFHKRLNEPETNAQHRDASELNTALAARIVDLERDCWHLIAMIEWLSEATGEGLELEDAALFGQIKSGLPLDAKTDLPGGLAAQGVDH